jgi:hypothetical protein
LDGVMVNLDVLAEAYDLDKILSWCKQAEEFLKGGNQQTGATPMDVLKKFLNDGDPK